MIITKLILKNFRSYSSCDLTFEKGLNVIVGKNGSGKTNVVEAIHYLSLTRSFRTSNDLDLIKQQTQQALIEAELCENDTKKQIRIIISNEGKIVLVNGKKVLKLSELSKVVNVIVFQPPDVSMFKDSPSTRRKFLDVSIAKQSPIYLERLIIYQKLLRERNNVLKGETINEQHLDIVTKQLIKACEPIVRDRIEYVGKLNSILQNTVMPRLDKDYIPKLIYGPFVYPDEDFEKKALLLYQRNLEYDKKRHTTTIGIHLEDIRLNINEKDVGKFGSQGENRIAALSLKLAPYYLAQEDNKPIVILDDVMSELDTVHQEKLITLMNELPQTFITATDINIDKAHYYIVENHVISRRNS